MKINNKGFAISTILYGLLALLIIILMLIFQIMRTNNNNSKELSQSIKESLEECRVERINYNNCTSDCNDEQRAYQKCIDPSAE